MRDTLYGTFTLYVTEKSIFNNELTYRVPYYSFEFPKALYSGTIMSMTLNNQKRYLHQGKPKSNGLVFLTEFVI